MSNEITVKLKCSIKEFCNIIESKGFEIVDRFLLDDTYFIPKDIEDGEKLIEIETVETNEDLNTVEKLKEKLNELKLPLDTKDYFIKKAEMKLKQISEDGV